MEDHHDHEHAGTVLHGIGGGPECTVCPVCVLLQAVSSVRPEVMQHVLNAGRELTLALTAMLEAQAEAYDSASSRHRARTEAAATKARVQHIDID